MFKTLIAGEAPSIQYQGVGDRSESRVVSLPTNGLIIGKFRRGRLDKPMWITAANIRARLGFDPDNPAYLAVADALDMGIGGVLVMNLLSDQSGGSDDDGGTGGTGGTGGSGISCVGAIPWAELDSYGDAASFMMKVDGVLVAGQGAALSFDAYQTANHPQFSIYSFGGTYSIHNNDSVEHRIEIIPVSPNPAYPPLIRQSPLYSGGVVNPTISIDPQTKIISFCLAAGA